MKRCKKIISVLLIVMLIAVQLIPILNVKAEGVEFILSDTVTKADDPNSKLITNNDVTITVTNFENTSTAKVFGYKIIDVFYNEATNEVSYQFTEEFQNFLDSNETYKDLTIERYFELTSDNPAGTASESVITTSTLNILLSSYLISRADSTSVKFQKSGNDESGYVASATVEVGVYLLEGTGTRDIYGVMSANAVPTINESGEWIITSPTIVAKKSAVSNELLTVTKQVMDVKQMLMTVELEYKVTIPELPTNAIDKENKKQFAFKVYTAGFESTMLLTLKNGEVELAVDENGSVFNGEELIENIVVSDGTVQIVDITKLENRNFTAIYTHDISSEDIVFGEAGNNFIAMTSYDSKQYENSNYSAFTMLTAAAYSYAISVQNLEKDTEDVLLNGANYELYRSYDAATNTLSDKVDIDFVIMEGGAITAVTEPGKYYVKQVRAPSGYRLSKEIVEIDVNTGSVNEQDAGIYMGIVYNEKMWFLPSTGGIGTVIYTLVGLSVVAISTYGIVYYRKKRISNI